METIKDLADGNQCMPEDIATQFQTVISEQLNLDAHYNNTLSRNPNADSVHLDTSISQQAENDVELLNQYINNLKVSRNSILEIKSTDKDENNDKQS